MTTPTDGPLADVAVDALHGSYCPKMCTFACPVTSATGRDDAVPWGFHRVVSDLATGRLPVVAEVAERLTACSGCLACRVPCVFDQDVPAQVRAGRAHLVAAGVSPAAVTAAVDHVRAGRTPAGAAPADPPAPDAAPTVAVIAGCRDDATTLEATVTVLRAAGDGVVVVVPEGCCGALLDDLGATDAADEARAALPAVPEGVTTVVATDPHCLPSVRAAGWAAVDLASHFDDAVRSGRLVFPAESWPASWHDPCVLARGEGVIEPPRRVLAAAGAVLTEPERSRERTGCSGAGLGLDLLDPAAADATAAARGSQLGDGRVVTACARARERLGAAGVDVVDLATALAERLQAPAAAPRQPGPPADRPTHPRSPR